jgi:hypothetical protein
MDAYKTSIAFCLDMSDDMKHIGLLAACVLPDERVRVEVVRVWKSTIAMRAELGPLVDRVKPRVMGWLSRGPSAALSPELKKLRKSRALSPQEVTQAVQGMSELISAGRLSHNGDNLLTSQLLTAEPRRSADGSFTLARPEGLYVELVFAMSGAVWLARQLPKPVKLRVVTSEGA